MIRTVRRITSLFVILTALTGCVLVPGSNIDPDQYSTETQADWFEVNRGVWFPGLRGIGQADTEEDVAAVERTVDVVAITSDLIADQNRQQMLNNAVAAAMPARLQQELAEYEYHVASGDVLQITVYDHPELTNPSGSNNNNVEFSGIMVENDGSIYYPYIGKVQVGGRTVDEIREAISTPLAEFITSPQVAVRVLRFNSKRAYVTGQVNEPGPQPITNVPMTVLDAIARAGGLAENANWHDVLLSRNGEEIRLSVYEMLNNGRLGQNMLLQHGDVLHVPVVGQRLIFVLGELNRVNTLPVGNMSMSLTEALTRSGGLNQVTSNAEGIFVIRPNEAEDPKLATVFQLDVKNAVSFAVGAQFMLEPSDIVYVTTAPVTRWNRVISQIIPSLNALITADRVGTL
ncbi:MAG: polysaccharide export protein Wza [Gammaproteobacteria bacterium]|nr:polysaccharide export protein Wza [Gammaproteobacteria bacterium]MBJ54309.1 polysaccharide export protein Wza [Gammaproteobacteria bacterium]|tara:strand:- start:388 stop:1593 length:1206 start_codon:yes stop_codon:yes gene_type:complete